jgi:hypothetical protein
LGCQGCKCIGVVGATGLSRWMLVKLASWAHMGVVSWVVCVGVIILAAVMQLGGFEAGTVLSLIPAWGSRGIAMHRQAG